MASPRKTFKTKAGTELPLLNLKGKEYLQVMHRIQWYREENPNGIIKTSMLAMNGEGPTEYAVFKAEIYVETERGHVCVASGHKKETRGGFEDFIEKAESGSIGRALAMCGYGTQFAADDLDEGDRLADSPAPVVEKEAQTLANTKEVENNVVAAQTLGQISKRTSFRRNTSAASTTEDI